MRKIAIAILLAGAASIHALANDSTAELSTGGLQFVRNDDVEMRSEDLYISTREIRVRYRFFNRSDKDVTVHVAFPMPEVKHEEFDVAIPSSDPVNLLDFATRVNGQPVKAEVEQRATVGGVDRSQMLRDLRLPLAPHVEGAAAALDRLPRDKQDELVRLGVAEINEYDAGKGMERHLAPRWSLHTTFYWQQTFPAQKETLIEHRYKPSVGGTVATSLGIREAAKEPWYQAHVRKFCVERDIINAAQRAGSNGFPEERIDYILTTGANWAGPIKDFRLVVDKGEASNLISFCGDGIKKISPTQFEMRKTDFTPQGNLSVLILKRARSR
jgi:hypothetical protein